MVPAPSSIAVSPPAPGFEAEIRPPGSKSLTNRALLLAAIARGTSRIEGALVAEDSALMCDVLRVLHVTLRDVGDAIEVDGRGGPLVPEGPGPAELFVGTAGTVARFVAAVVAAGPGHVRMDGSARMRERPMGELFDALRTLGARIVEHGAPGCLPVEIGPRDGVLPGGEVRLERPASSQFVSGLVFAAAVAGGPVRIVLEQGTPARPYVDMTLEALRDLGGRAEWESESVLVVTPRPLSARVLEVEPDASSASYFLALAAIHRGRVRILGLGTDSRQGDARFHRVLAQMGAASDQTGSWTQVQGTGELRGGDFDLGDMPDMTLTLAATALWARGRTRIRGVGILRHHESDRIAAAATELRKLGARVIEHDDGLEIEPAERPPVEPVAIDTYRDHRMAMAFSLAGRVLVRDPGCVGKTFPGYFEELSRLGMITGPNPAIVPEGQR
jgi:3-phosphoshikimate 1-carboxyvinyltransferase